MSQRLRKILFWVILQFSLVMAPPAHSAPLQCEYPGINPSGIFANGIDQAGIIANAMFNVDLPPFGEVCFVAKTVILPGHVTPSHIELELFQDGRRVYTLPEPEVPLLYGSCNVAAVSFPKLGRDERKSIIVLLRCATTKDEMARAVIYLPGDNGFNPDTELSDKTIDVDTIAKVVAKVKKLLVKRNRTHP